jgi:hypothetical protein
MGKLKTTNFANLKHPHIRINEHRLSMKHQTITVLLLLSSFTSLFAQQEIFFDNTPKDSISIKSFQYIQLEARNIVRSNLAFPTMIGYAAENKITKSIALITSANIVGGGYYKPIIVTDNFYTSGNALSRTQVQFGTSILLNADLRWYFGFKHRYMTGHNTLLNSGWFVSAPIELSTSTLFLEPLNLNLTVIPSIGYRIAPSKQFFLETSIGIFEPILPKSFGNTQFSLKACYVFNTKK